MSVREGYKQTEIGVIPEEWEVVQLKNIGTVVTGSTPKTTIKEYYQNGTNLWVSPSDLGKGKEVKDTSTKLSDLGFEQTRKVPKKSVLVTCIGSTIGKIGIASKEMSTNQQINTLVCDIDNDGDFYYYVLDSKKEYIRNLAGTQAVPLLNKSDFSAIKVIKPPLPEQRKIAAILSSVDKKIEAIDEQIAKTEKLKKGLMQKLLRDGIGHTEFKESEIGRIPKEWEVVRLGEIALIKDGTHFSPKSKSGPRKYVTSKNIKFGHFDDSTISYISQKEHDEIYKRCPVKKGQLLLTKDGANTGNACINPLEEPFSLLSSVALIDGKLDKLDNLYLLQWFLSHQGQKNLKGSMAGQAITRLTLTKISAHKLPLPSISEQKQIAKILSTTDNKLDTLREKKSRYERLKKGLMQKLLTGEIRTIP